jgi:hypothetical protein
VERDFAPRTLEADDPDLGIMSLQAGGQKLSAADRDRLLGEMRTGAGPSRLSIVALTFLQRETPNRNFSRFKPSILKKLAKSFEGRPVLRDHEHGNLAAVAGRITSSELVEHKGVPAFAQTLELVKPWAIEAALDGTISTFSIGWHNTGDVECSACGQPMARSIFGAMPSCSHFPGDKLEGKDGDVYVEAVITGAEGVEVSAVSVPAVTGTHIGEIRAALAAQRLSFASHPPKETKSMKTIANKLGLAETADEPAILGAIIKLQSLEALHAAELAAHGMTRAQLVEAQGKLALVEKASRDQALAEITSIVERKTGKGEEGKRFVAAALLLADVSLTDGLAFANRLPSLTGIGGPLLSRGTEPEGGAEITALTPQQKKIARQLKLTEAQYLAQLNAQAAG